MMILKKGVSLKGLQPQILVALQVAEGVYRESFGVPLVVTSANDGRHRNGSLHYKGLAVDLRVHNLPDAYTDGDPVKARALIAGPLGRDFDVLYEYGGTPNAHIHIEWDPKP